MKNITDKRGSLLKDIEMHYIILVLVKNRIGRLLN
ncbi:MAG: hypothetical protein UW23_C0034G0009 [Candidatus Collierbacteria bacterium GW2011_GWA1_44_12]|uniref:Uncharacterized protein n=1 Tax=Candidatus Collierbacteria bacterium GW2011_GWA1_44_12 TaxID=1618376 RepID=A0A0G1GJ46_9BACT|nr:MAG: hypothetical protein UW23_C0034G0009 [Candidatus Collierbacteria bacterium GW2011_GWA1_44_12]